MKKLWLLLLIFLVGCTATGKVVHESLDISVYFCPQDNCSQNLVSLIESAENRVHCAFYDLKLDNVKEALFGMSNKVDVLLIIDNHNAGNLDKFYWIRKDKSSKLMHNKFCVIDDDYVWTGSFNPTTRGDTMNNNNALLVKSNYLNQNYESEFKEMWYGRFSRGDLVEYPKISFIENYFCPEDSCSSHVLETLSKAQESIKFMTFSFTDDNIGDLLVAKHKAGVKVQGVFEKTQNNAWNEYEKLKQAGLDVQWDNNKANMHHKVFIIDDSIVITGSYNPSANGDRNNDENVLIIYDEGIGGEYVKEFNKITNFIIS